MKMKASSSQGGRPRVLVVVGTRPEAIKMAPVLAGLARRDARLETRLALTGQHTDMVDQVLEALDLHPDYDLGIMQEGQDQYDLAHACLDGVREVVSDFRPGILLVQGDTASAFYASLVAFLEGVSVGHVEAGLRSEDKWEPFPEEMYRRLSDVLTDLHFAPTPRARENLLKEGVAEEGVHVTGNTVVDALLSVAQRPRTPDDATLRSLLQQGTPFVLLTAHRRESFGHPLREVFSAVRRLADDSPEIDILYPVHPNPQVQEPAKELLSDHPRIHLTPPLGYLDLVAALKEARLVLTDSGGIQEEAPTFGTPVLVLRNVTERPEGVETGVASLVGTRGDRILDAASAALRSATGQRKGVAGPNPYGDGRAGDRIADIVSAALAGTPRETTDWDGA